MKIRPVRAELFHADRQTDGHDKANGRFSKFCERAYKELCDETRSIDTKVTGLQTYE
jgi:hypothetical protein